MPLKMFREFICDTVLLTYDIRFLVELKPWWVIELLRSAWASRLLFIMLGLHLMKLSVLPSSTSSSLMFSPSSSSSKARVALPFLWPPACVVAVVASWVLAPDNMPLFYCWICLLLFYYKLLLISQRGLKSTIKSCFLPEPPAKSIIYGE